MGSISTVRRIALGCSSALLFLLVAFVGVAWADITATEGQSFSGHVANTCGFQGGVIDWGDSTPTSDGTNDGPGVSGTHTYAEEGTFTGNVAYMCPSVSGTFHRPFQATVQDAPLTGSGRDVSGVAGQPLTGVVAHIEDANPGGDANDFSAQITWGDGTSSAGSVAAAAGGGFDVTGTHSYNTAGNYPVSTSITDVGTSTAAGSSTSQVASSPPPPGRTLTVSTSGGGSGTVTGTGIDCGGAGHSACSASVSDGTVLTLTATPAAGSQFAGFTGGGCGVTSPCTVTMNADQSVHAKFDLTPPPPMPVPRNMTRPSISWSLYRDTFICNPGTWENLPPNPVFAYEWLRRGVAGGHSRAGVSVVATTQAYNPNGSQRLFACRVTAHNAAGATAATSDFAPLVPLTVPTFAYGNVRIRGIDVFQVVQPNSCSAMYGYLPNAAFACLPGGGTPNANGVGRPGTDNQNASYLGVPIDADKRTTAVVYVDSTEALSSPSQPLDVTLLARYNGRQIGNITLTRRITNPPLSSTPWVTAAERANPLFGVQFQIPAIWLQVPATLGGTLDLEAKVQFPTGTSKLITECSPGRDCSSDDTFRLSGVPSQHVAPLNVRTVELLGGNQAPDGGITAPDQVLSRAGQLYPGGDGMEVQPYGAWLGVRDQEALTATSVPPNQGEVPPVFTCNGVRYASSPGAAATVVTATRSCRSSAIGAVVARWETDNPGSGYDLTAMVHDYVQSPGANIEPGWTAGSNATLTTAQRGLGAFARPLILINDGSAKRPLTAAAHEFGHAIGMPHAELFPYANQAKPDCGGSTGGQVGEAWPPDNEGRLQGVKFDQARLAFGRATDIVPLIDGQGPQLFDLMSYCAPEANAWLSARNWNRAFRTLTDYDARVNAASDRASAASSARVSHPAQAFAVGVVGSDGGRIVRVVPPHGNEVIPAPVPSSPLRLRAFDAGGRALGEVGVMIQGLTFAGAPAGGGTFVGPVPVNAATVELVRDGIVLDRKQRNRPPRVRLLAPDHRTRARGELPVRWSASDPDGDALQATVDYSRDGGLTWRTVYDGPSLGRALVPGPFLEGSARARIRVFVNDGFNEARAVSQVFRAEGTAPVARIIRPDSTEPLRAGERTLLIGSAFDDRHRRLRGRALTWYAGRRRLGTGEQLSAALPPGRIVLRLLARDQSGRQTLVRRALRVAPLPLRLLQLSYSDRVRHGGRTITARISATAPATLRVGGQRYRVGVRSRLIVVPLPRRPATGLLTLPYTLTAADRGASGIERGTIMAVRS